MTRQFYKECIEEEVYAPYRQAKQKMSVLDKIWCRYLSPESNAIYLIRRKQLFESKASTRFLSRFYHVLLMRRYGIHITPCTTIGKGLRIAHPTGIVVTLCKIGDNFTICQNCTIGQKKWKSGQFPTIGNNVTMYSGSSIIGEVNVSDNCIIGANATLLSDTEAGGVYCGTPARLISNSK